MVKGIAASGHPVNGESYSSQDSGAKPYTNKQQTGDPCQVCSKPLAASSAPQSCGQVPGEPSPKAWCFTQRGHGKLHYTSSCLRPARKAFSCIDASQHGHGHAHGTACHQPLPSTTFRQQKRPCSSPSTHTRPRCHLPAPRGLSWPPPPQEPSRPALTPDPAQLSCAQARC